MTNAIVKQLTPEEQELERKKLELAAIENELTDRELDLNTLEAELRAFERRYLRGVGRVFPELLQNSPTFAPTMRIDSKLLGEAESVDGKSWLPQRGLRGRCFPVLPKQ